MNPDAIALAEVFASKWVPAALMACMRMGIPETLSSGPIPIEELAERSQAQVESLYRLMRALARSGYFEESGGRMFSLNAKSRLLVKGVPDSIYNMACNHAADWSTRSWSHLEQAVRSNGSNVPEVLGAPSLWDYFERRPDEAATFHGAMVEWTRWSLDGILAVARFDRFQRLVDLGGGSAEFLAGVLRAIPALHGVNFDLPRALEGACATLQEAGVAGRCEVIAGSLLERVPDGADAYVLKGVLHTFSDELARTALVNCRAALGPEARLFIIEHVVPPAGPYAQFLDLQMLVSNHNGRERTIEEFDQLLAQTGLMRLTTLSTGGLVSVIEAKTI